jgi:hypothetical protein
MQLISKVTIFLKMNFDEIYINTNLDSEEYSSLKLDCEKEINGCNYYSYSCYFNNPNNVTNLYITIDNEIYDYYQR